MREILSGFGFLTGASYPFRTLAFLRRHPQLSSYILVPILVNTVIGAFLYVSLFSLGSQFLQEFIVSLTSWSDNTIANLPDWLKFLDYIISGFAWLVQFLFSLFLLVLTGFLLAQFGVLIGSPWYGKLSEKIEKIRTDRLTVVEVGILRDIGRAVLFELKKVALAIAVGILLFLLNFLPGLGTLIATTGGIALAATLTCLDFLDAPLERRRLKFRDKLGIIWQSLPASAGFSLVCLASISIPLLNLVTIPLCVAAGTLFFCDRVLGNSERAD